MTTRLVPQMRRQAIYAIALALIAIVATCVNGTRTAAATVGDQAPLNPGAQCSVGDPVGGSYWRQVTVYPPNVRATGDWRQVMWYTEVTDSNGTALAGMGWVQASDWVWVAGDNTWRP